MKTIQIMDMVVGIYFSMNHEGRMWRCSVPFFLLPWQRRAYAYSCVPNTSVTILLFFRKFFLPTLFFYLIGMSHWCHTMVDGADFWISYQGLILLRKASHWQWIRYLVWRLCDIWINEKNPSYISFVSP